MTSKRNAAGIRAVKGHSGGVRAALWPVGPAMGLASALAAGGALAQEPSPPSDAPHKAQSAPTSQQGAENTFVLPTVHVQQGALEDYKPTESQLQKVTRPLVDTPQTVTVVPQQVLEEQQVTTVRDALRNVSGITVTAGEGGRQGDTFNLRGFSAQTDTFRDGVRDLGWFTRDTFNLGGVEVFFGPSSVLFGRGSTGGAINLVTKRPEARAQSSVSLLGSTAPAGRLEADVNAPLGDDVQLRVNAVGQLADVAGRDFVTENRAGLAPAVRFLLSPRTTLDVDYLYQHEDSTPDYGLPYYNGYPVATSYGVDRSTFYGVKGGDQELVNAHVATAQVNHRFGAREDALLTNTVRFGAVDRFSRPTAPRGLAPATDPLTIGRQRFETATNNTYLVDQTNVRFELNTGLVKHSASAGLELSYETRDQSRNNLNAVGLPTGANLPADLFDPDPHPDLSAVSRVFSGSSTTRQWDLGVYAADQLSITRFIEVLGSLRFDVFDTHYTALSSTNVRTDLKNQDRFFNWRVGLVGHPVDKTSLYVTYGTSANPSAELGTLSDGTVTLAPERDATLEVGAKADLLSERLGLNASLFRIDKLNARLPNPDPTLPAQVLAGAQRVEGFNVGVAGSLTSFWKVIANYTHMNSAILKNTNAYLVGQPLPNTPRRSLSLWTTVSPLRAFTLGGGAVYQDVTTVNNPTSDAQSYSKVPNFWRFDAFASYTILQRVDLQLNVNNLTNALYYSQYYAGQAVPATGRSASLTARVHF